MYPVLSYGTSLGSPAYVCIPSNLMFTQKWLFVCACFAGVSDGVGIPILIAIFLIIVGCSIMKRKQASLHDQVTPLLLVG